MNVPKRSQVNPDPGPGTTEKIYLTLTDASPETVLGRWHLVAPFAEMLRRLHRARGRDGEGGQPDRGESRQARAKHHRQLPPQLRAGLEQHAHRLQQRHLDADPEVRACQVQGPARPTTQRNGRRK